MQSTQWSHKLDIVTSLLGRVSTFQVNSVPATYQTWTFQQCVIVTPHALVRLAGLINLGIALHGL